VLTDEQMPKAITPAFKDGNAIKIKSIIDNRCATCHNKGSGEAQADGIPLTNYEEIATPHMEVKQAAAVNGYIRVEEPLSLTKLTQSTHAHLLSFAVLFSLTGGIFAFSSYNTKLRCLLGPWVVLAVFADVSLWWLARLSEDWGPYFAMGIVFTGAAAGAGLFGQIVLSLFNMYGMMGKVVLALLFLLGGGIASLVWVNKIDPGLKEKDQQRQQQKNVQKAEPSKENGNGKDNSNGNGNGKDTTPPKKDNGDTIKNTKPHVPINALDRLLTLPRLDDKGQPIPNDQLTWDGSGSMAPAFFEKDKSKAFPKMMDDPMVLQAEKDKLKAHRQAELDAALAWIRSADDARKAAYEGDSFGMAPELAGKVTPDFVKDGKVKIKSLIDTRCAACHSPGKPQKGLPLTNYEEIAEYLKPEAPAAKAVDPIPEAKDD
jgi:mono/diheme cytochrome c family protein